MRRAPVVLTCCLLLLVGCEAPGSRMHAFTASFAGDGGGLAGDLTRDPGSEPDAGPSQDGIDADVPSDEAGGPQPVTEGCEPFEQVVTLLADEPMELLYGASAYFEVEVPEHTISVSISVVGDTGTYYALGHWVGPGTPPSVLVDTSWMQVDQVGASAGMCLICANRIAPGESTFAALAPNNPEPVVEAGTHSMSVLGYVPQGRSAVPADGTVLVSVHAKVLPEPPATGVLDLNLHFTGAQGYTAATAPTSPGFQAILEKVREIYGTVGIELGRLTYLDVDPSFKVIESIQGADSDLERLFRQSAGNDTNAANLFFVDEISSGGGGFGFSVILGISGGIPGPALVQGTHRSGVAIVVKPMEPMPWGPPLPGPETTMAHELGHFLGLFHTSENEFSRWILGEQLHDPLPDTPENDESWLMHNVGSGHKLSEWQGIVMRSNPWVCHPEGHAEVD